MSGLWNAHATGMLVARRPGGLEPLEHRLDRRRRSRDDGLVGRVVVRDHDAVETCEVRRKPVGAGQDRGHGPRIASGGVRGSEDALAAGLAQPQEVGFGERAGHAERDELAVAVAGDEIGLARRGCRAGTRPPDRRCRARVGPRVSVSAARWAARSSSDQAVGGNMSSVNRPPSERKRCRRGNATNRSRSMPTRWLPWPGKRKAILRPAATAT